MQNIINSLFGGLRGCYSSVWGLKRVKLLHHLLYHPECRRAVVDVLFVYVCIFFPFLFGKMREAGTVLGANSVDRAFIIL
jgi:hypothetical protein